MSLTFGALTVFFLNFSSSTIIELKIFIGTRMLETSLRQIYVTAGTTFFHDQLQQAFGINHYVESANRISAKKITLLEILETKGFRTALICYVAGVDGHLKQKQIYALWCANRVKHIIENQACLRILDLAETIISEESPWGPSGRANHPKILGLLEECLAEERGEHMSLAQKSLEKEFEMLYRKSKIGRVADREKYQRKLENFEKTNEWQVHKMRFWFQTKNTSLEDRSRWLEIQYSKCKTFLESIIGSQLYSSHSDIPNFMVDNYLESEFWSRRLELCTSILYATMLPKSGSHYLAIPNAVELTQKFARNDPNLLELQTERLREIFSQ